MPPSPAPLPLPRLTDPAHDAHAVRMRRFRPTRRSWAHVAAVRAHAVAALTVVAWVALALFLCGGVALIADEAGPSGATLTVVVVLLLSILVTALRLTARINRARGWRPVMHELAQQLDGRLRPGVAGRLAWLDRHWLGDLLPIDIHHSTHGGSVSLVAQGYPLLIVFDPLPLIGRGPARIEVLLAGTQISVSRSQRWAAESWRWFDQRGYRLGWSEAGLRATATAQVTRTLARTPRSSNGTLPDERDWSPVGELATIVHALATAAALLHAKPFEPLS